MNRAQEIANAAARTSAHASRKTSCGMLAAVALACWGGAAAAQHGEEAHNARLAGMHNLQGRSAYHGVIVHQGGRWIAYVGHHDGSARNPLTGAVEDNGNSIVDVTNVRNPVYLHHLPAEGGSQMVQVCSGERNA